MGLFAKYYLNQPLYHGTDMRILMMSKEERELHKQECIEAIDYMWQFISPLNESYQKQIRIPSQPEPVYILAKRIDDLKPLLSDIMYSNIIGAIFCNEQRLIKQTKYCYEYTYLTADKDTAIRYARRSFKFGEIGQIAYRFYELINVIKPDGWNPSAEIEKTLHWLCDFVDAEPDPVILEVHNLFKGHLYLDSGRPFSEIEQRFKGEIHGHFYYTGDLNLFPENAIRLPIINSKK